MDGLYKAHLIYVTDLHEHRPLCHMRVQVLLQMRQDDEREETSLNHLEPDSWFYLN